MKPLILVAAGLMAISCSVSALAGPDFYVIEKARAAKRAEPHPAPASSAAADKKPESVSTATPRGVIYPHS
ncbi:hypothetical protein [Cupriavidus campinensis]